MSWEKVLKEEWGDDTYINDVEMENTESYQRKLNSLRDDERGNPISKLLGMLGHEATGELNGEEYEITLDIEKLQTKMIRNFQDRIKNAEKNAER